MAEPSGSTRRTEEVKVVSWLGDAAEAADERLEADLSRLLHPCSGYAHAENLLVLLRAYEKVMPHREAVRRVHSEVVHPRRGMI